MTALDLALAGVTKLGIDTSPFIYFIERVPDYIAVVREVIRRVDAGAIAACTCTITLTEVLVQPMRVQNGVLQLEYLDLLTRGRNLALVDVTVAVAERAADLRARYSLRTPDALQVAAAIDAGCEAFITNDKGIKRVTELKVFTLNELSI